MSDSDGKVTGIGGIFLKCKDPDKMKEWYGKHLGMFMNQYGCLFEFRKASNPEEVAYLQWGTMKESTDYFNPSKKQFMVNYRVRNLEKLLADLKDQGIDQVGEMETYDYGKFAWVMDPEGNKLELWEPVDSVFTKDYSDQTTKE